jgi:ATP-binding cassette, subfamily B, multidrug efflux pump
MLNLVKHLRSFVWQIAIVIVLTFAQVITNLQLPDYMAKIINQGVIGQNTGIIFNTGATMLLVSLAGGVCTIGVGFLAARIATGFSMQMREKIFSKVESFSLTEFNQFSTASLITRTTNDIQQIQMVLVMMLRMVLIAPIMGIGAVVKAYHLAPSMTWIMVLAVSVITGIIILLFNLVMPRFQLIQKLVDKLNLVTRQSLTGLKVIRAFNTEKTEEKKFDKVNVDLTEVNLFVNRLMAVMQPIMMLVFNLTAIAIIWVGAHLVGSGDLMIGNMMAYMQYAMQVIMSFLMMSIIFIMLPRASVSGERVADVLAIDSKIKDPEHPDSFSKDIIGQVEFDNVSFVYPGADVPVLQNISFIVKRGETTAFIGSTGSGKSTLINLIPRFFDVTSGQILIDGVDVCRVKPEDLRNKIGYVAQKAILFSGTIKSNICYGVPHASDKDIEKAVKVAQAEEFIKKLPDKLNSPVSQGGTNFSGGQKQRLAIARALIKKPEVYIFDDSFSALDLKTDLNLREALRRETKEATVLIVGQRVSTIINADKIIVLDEGKIVGMGTHHQLMNSCDIYREIALSQLSKKELTEMEADRNKEISINSKKEEVQYV